jgi:hypothetical protein
MNYRRAKIWLVCVLVLTIQLLSARSADADAWWDAHWQFRRPVEVNWDAGNASGSELAEIRFFTAGHVNPTGNDIRVATQNGTPVPTAELMVGPGDSARAVFQLQPNIAKYYVYFGNPAPAPVPASIPEIKFNCGLLMETKLWSGPPVANADQVAASWIRSTNLLGRTMVDRPFMGVNPFGDQAQIISKLSGQISAPVDGKYTFAVSAEARGALFIDGSALVFAQGAPGDIRFRADITLKRGRHDFVFYHVRNGNEGKFSVGWQRPDMAKVDVIARDAFGVLSRGSAGALEELETRVVADFAVKYEGECFCEGNYSHRFRFDANVPAAGKSDVQWDFGDGLSSGDASVEHVFMTEGVYPIRLTIHTPAGTDTQTTKLLVSRDYEHLDQPPTDPPQVQSTIVGKYDVSKMPVNWLPAATILHERANRPLAMIATATQLAGAPSHGDAAQAFNILQEITESEMMGAEADKMMAVWDAVPAASDLQPRAARYDAQLLMWNKGDFDRAVKVTEPFVDGAKNDIGLQRTYAEALILDQKVELGKRILKGLAAGSDIKREAALSGAQARSIEFYIDQKDWESGEEAWEKWEAMYPDAFLEGYSVLLRMKLMEIKRETDAAAKLGEAFADAMPNSSYSPALLDRASKLLAKSDPIKSKQLHDELKKRYPEDPLSQD